MRRTLSIRINGGIGNQLFQYAAGFALSRAWDARLDLDIPPKKHEQFFGHPRKFALDEFAISGRPLPFNPFTRLLASRNKSFFWFLRPLRRCVSVGLLDEMPGMPFDPALLHTPPAYRHVSLWGYWQSYKWAEQCEGMLRTELRFKNPPAGKNAKMLERIRNCDCAISLHIRRGDYLKINGAPLLCLDYYRSAIHEMVSRVQADAKPEQLNSQIPPARITFFVFSDDIPWCKKELPQLFSVFPLSSFHLPLCFVDHNDEAHPHEDLRLMSACRHHIVASSSFSWWGAWLNPESSKIVIRPSMGNEHAEYFPPEWYAVS